MSEPASISSGIAQRYATAIFELSKEAKALKALEKDVDALKDALAQRAELRNLISSPVYSRDDVPPRRAPLPIKWGCRSPSLAGWG